MTSRHINFSAINRVALTALPGLLARWLPDGRREGNEWVARNPRRHDRHLGSFKINLITGKWADFATGEGGGDPVSLAAYLSGQPQAKSGTFAICASIKSPHHCIILRRSSKYSAR